MVRISINSVVVRFEQNNSTTVAFRGADGLKHPSTFSASPNIDFSVSFRPLFMNNDRILISSSAYLETRYYTHGISPFLEVSIIGSLDTSSNNYTCVYTTRSGQTHYSELSQSKYPVERMEHYRSITCPVQLLASEDSTWNDPIRVTIELNGELGNWATVLSPPNSPFPPVYDFNEYEDITKGTIGICIPPIHGSIPKDAVDGFFSTV
jgi:hypothetical protein